jgi:LysM repeat protein
VVYARSQAERLARLPEIEEPKNSQNMALLEGFLNTIPTGTGGSEVTIVDNTALFRTGDETSSFVDAAKSGSQISVYIVRKGDTLSSIAQLFEVSVNTVVWANDIKSGTIKEGQELVILPISGVRHTVKSGDTLKSIATRYKADIDDILIYNDLTADSKLATGEIIVVPGGEIVSTPRVAPRVNGSLASNATAGYFMRPISGGKKSQGIHPHNAVDLAAPIGTPIVAAASGNVVVAREGGYNGGYGSYVVISHPNGTQTLYAHMSRVSVSVGQQVSQGQNIGAVGNTGRSTGPHVHFEVRGARQPF